MRHCLGFGSALQELPFSDYISILALFSVLLVTGSYIRRNICVKLFLVSTSDLEGGVV